MAPTDETGTTTRSILLPVILTTPHRPDIRGIGKVLRERADKIPSRFQTIIPHPALCRLLPLGTSPFFGRLHVGETGGISLIQILPLPSRRHHLRRPRHLRRETLASSGKIELKPGRADESWADVAVRVVGYCWVTLWFCSVLPVWLDESSAIGFSSTDRGVVTQFLLENWTQRA